MEVIIVKIEVCMQWLEQYQLVLLDFDGLLVNTEHIHYRAYQKMCADRGVNLTWDFPTYCSMAHYSSDVLRKELSRLYPRLHENGATWDTLYQEKKEAYLKLLDQGAVTLMPGAEEFLRLIEKNGIQRCVVTNSGDELIKKIVNKLPQLKTISHWITREKYQLAKPDPECYQLAIKTFAKPQDKILGIEDTPRGLQALRATRAEPILVSELSYPEITQFKKEGIRCFRSFHQLLSEII